MSTLIKETLKQAGTLEQFRFRMTEIRNAINNRTLLPFSAFLIGGSRRDVWRVAVNKRRKNRNRLRESIEKTQK